MTFKHFWENAEYYQNTGIRRYILVKTGTQEVEVLQVLDVRVKAIKVTLASRPRLYSGQDMFWIPWAALALRDDNEDLLDMIQFTPWYHRLMEGQNEGRQIKQNLNILF